VSLWQYGICLWLKMEFKNRSFGILGAARSGIAAAKKLLQLEANVFLTDKRPISELSIDDDLISKIVYKFGDNSDKLLDCDTIIVSPGIPLTIPILKNASKRGIRIISEIELGYQICKKTNLKIIGITGSNGKSTTASLIYHILARQYKDVILAGNIGSPFTAYPLETGKIKFAVLEISSFQLDTIWQFHPYISIILNITPDHLNRYMDFDHYRTSKSRIFLNQDENDFCILNYKDENCTYIAKYCKAQKIFFNNANGMVHQERSNIVIKMDNERIVIPKRKIKLKGPHNLANIESAIYTSLLLNVEVDKIIEGIVSFSGLVHRLEYVDEINSIKFINDSKATNTDAVKYALQSYDKPIVLIMGGSDKGEDFSILKPYIKNVICLILLGETAEKIKNDLSKKSYGQTNIPIVFVNDMKEAVQRAYKNAVPDSYVLLSPACASYDQFDNFEQRGEIFKKYVRELKNSIIAH